MLIAGEAGSFTVTATGFPTPSITRSGSLPSGVTFSNNGNGTATLAGTPASGAVGVYHLTFTASNGVSPNATQTFTLKVISLIIYLPLNLKQAFSYAVPCEWTHSCEDYGTVQTAYGPLLPTGSYNAYPDDAEDYYYITLLSPASVTVQVTGYQASGQLFVYDEQLNELGWDNNPDNDQVLTLGPLNLSQGKYYIRIYTAEPFNPSDLYQLVITY
jgi:hypothetical protein